MRTKQRNEISEGGAKVLNGGCLVNEGSIQGSVGVKGWKSDEKRVLGWRGDWWDASGASMEEADFLDFSSKSSTMSVRALNLPLSQPSVKKSLFLQKRKKKRLWWCLFFLHPGLILRPPRRQFIWLKYFILLSWIFFPRPSLWRDHKLSHPINKTRIVSFDISLVGFFCDLRISPREEQNQYVKTNNVQQIILYVVLRNIIHVCHVINNE